MESFKALSQYVAHSFYLKRVLKPKYLALGICTICGTLCSVFMLRCGILASPDSWAYWEGSVSILQNGTFSFLDGQKIIWWPPLFSIWLAAFQAIGMTTGFWLIVAMCGLTFINCLIWGRFALTMSCSDDGHVMWLPYISSLVFIAVFIPVCGIRLLAHFLLLSFVGLTFLCVVSAELTASDRKWLINAICVGLSLTLALMTHYSAIIYVAAVIPLIIAEKCRSGRVRCIAIITTLTLSTLPWLAYRIVSEAGSSHAFSIQNFVPLQHLIYSMAGLSDLMFTTDSVHWITRTLIGVFMACGIALLAIVSSKKTERFRVRKVSLLVLLSYMGLYGIFNLAPITDPLMDRFLWYIPLAIVPAVFRVVHTRKWLMALTIAICLSVSVKRSLVLSVTAAVRPCRKDETTVSSNYILSYYWLGPDYQKTVRSELERISPPTYPWQARWESTQKD